MLCRGRRPPRQSGGEVTKLSEGYQRIVASSFVLTIVHIASLTVYHPPLRTQLLQLVQLAIRREARFQALYLPLPRVRP
jgi:heme exporter protein D